MPGPARGVGMLRALDRAVAQLSALVLLAGLCLVGAGVLGVAAGPVLFAPLLAATVALYLAREILPRVELVRDWALADLGEDLWLAPLIGAAAMAVAPNATAGELQSIGGLLGLAALLNYFLRPIYRLLVRLARRVGLLAPESR